MNICFRRTHDDARLQPQLLANSVAVAKLDIRQADLGTVPTACQKQEGPWDLEDIGACFQD